MDPSRLVLTDRPWLAIGPLCPGSVAAPGRAVSDTRLFLKAVLWVVRTDAPLFVTERAVFRLGATGLDLIEIAPGIDIERDILGHMEFLPGLENVAEMDARIFRDEPMALDVDLLALDLDARIALAADRQQLFINLEKLRIRNVVDVARIVVRVEEVCGTQDREVDAMVNYDGTTIYPDSEEQYVAAVQRLADTYYRSTARYSGSAFMRMKLGKAFGSSKDAHIFETAEDARRFIEQG